jgi:hypothetical protein
MLGCNLHQLLTLWALCLGRLRLSISYGRYILLGLAMGTRLFVTLMIFCIGFSDYSVGCHIILWSKSIESVGICIKKSEFILDHSPLI